MFIYKVNYSNIYIIQERLPACMLVAEGDDVGQKSCFKRPENER